MKIETEKKILSMLDQLQEGQTSMQSDVAELKTNEKKILSELDQLQQGQTSMQSDISTLKTDVSTLKTDVSGLKTDVSTLKTDVSSLQKNQEAMQTELTMVRITQETLVLPKIQLLAEGHCLLAEKISRLENVPEQIEDIQNTTNILKTVFKEHIHEHIHG